MKHQLTIQLVLVVFMGGLYGNSPTGLTLDQLIDIGLANNSEMLIADRSLAAAKAESRGSYSGLVPSVRGNLRQDLTAEPYLNPYTGSIVEPTPFSSAVSVSQTLFDGAISWYNARSGMIGAKQAEAGYSLTRRQVALGISQAYYQVLSARALVEVAEEAVALARRQLELVEERFRLQAVSETDLLKAKVSVGQRQADLYQARQNMSTALTNLKVTIGQDPMTPLEVAGDSGDLKNIPSREAAVRQLLENHPGLERQAASVDLARLNAKRQRGVMLPSASINYSLNTSGAELANLYESSDDATTLSLSIPLFTGLRNSSQYARARYNQYAEEDRLEGTERDLKRQLENTLASLEALHEIYPVNQEVLASAEADVRLADEQYNLGAISILDLLNAQVSLISARSTLVRTLYDIKLAEAQLEALTGSTNP